MLYSKPSFDNELILKLIQMAILKSTYKLPFGLWNKHLQTAFSTLFRKIEPDFYQREKFELADGDFLNIDWIKNDSSKCVILSHGLEGDSRTAYTMGMARYFSENDFTVCAWNYRGCGDELNRSFLMYHSGFTDDLHELISEVAKSYDEVYLIGFSIGGNISLKYLGEGKHPIDEKVKACVAFSVPLKLKDSCLHLEKPSNFIYKNRFLKRLKEKIIAKELQFPDQLSSKDLGRIKNLKDFDDLYTAPMYGFKDAFDYYEKCSSMQFIKNIKTPTLIILARNDPFLPESCYPIEECKEHQWVDLEMPEQGGHVGFIQFGDVYWSEHRALQYFKELKSNG